MIPKFTFVIGILIIILSLIWLGLWTILPIGINDGEWGHIFETGLPSGGGSGLVWTDWRTNEISEVKIFCNVTNVPSDSPILAYRFGKGEDICLSFGFYQAKCMAKNGDFVVVPAEGPKSWTRMKWSLPLTFLALGLVLMGTGAILRKRTQRIGTANT